eukprot:3813862-Rhodomonas_salina.2
MVWWGRSERLTRRLGLRRRFGGSTRLGPAPSATCCSTCLVHIETLSSLSDSTCFALSVFPVRCDSELRRGLACTCARALKSVMPCTPAPIMRLFTILMAGAPCDCISTARLSSSSSPSAGLFSSSLASSAHSNARFASSSSTSTHIASSTSCPRPPSARRQHAVWISTGTSGNA